MKKSSRSLELDSDNGHPNGAVQKNEDSSEIPSELLNDGNGTFPKVKIWVKLFVIFHVIAITIWAIPNPPSDYLDGKTKWIFDYHSAQGIAKSINFGIRDFDFWQLKSSPIKYYDLATGFWQYWDMFAPNPANVDIYGSALITYKNGQVKYYQYPRMYDLGIIMKYEKERFRKYYERAHDDAYQYVWPQFAQHIAQLNYSDPNNPPVEVKLYRYWQDVADAYKYQNPNYQKHMYFDYKLNSEETQRMINDSRSMFNN